MGQKSLDATTRALKLFQQMKASGTTLELVIAQLCDIVCRRLQDCPCKGTTPLGQCIARPQPCKYLRNPPALTSEVIQMAEAMGVTIEEARDWARDEAKLNKARDAFSMPGGKAASVPK